MTTVLLDRRGRGWCYNPLATMLNDGDKRREAASAGPRQGTVGPGVLGAPPYIHHNEDEYFYILEGEITLLVADDTCSAPAGTISFVPKGTVQTFWNEASHPARLLEIFTPAGFEKYFEELPSLLPPDGGARPALRDGGVPRKDRRTHPEVRIAVTRLKALPTNQRAASPGGKVAGR